MHQVGRVQRRPAEGTRERVPQEGIQPAGQSRARRRSSLWRTKTACRHQAVLEDCKERGKVRAANPKAGMGISAATREIIDRNVKHFSSWLDTRKTRRPEDQGSRSTSTSQVHQLRRHREH